jgi:DNA-directed RNA polymerase subunit RPC12/RpoP
MWIGGAALRIAPATGTRIRVLVASPGSRPALGFQLGVPFLPPRTGCGRYGAFFRAKRRGGFFSRGFFSRGLGGDRSQTMKLHCSHCGKTFTAPDSWENTKVRCPSCNQIIDTRKPAEKSSEKPAARENPPRKAPPARKPKPATKPPRGQASPSSPAPPAPGDPDDEFQLQPEQARPATEFFLESSPIEPKSSPSKKPPVPRKPNTPPAKPPRKIAGVAGESREPGRNATEIAPVGTREKKVPGEKPKPKSCPNCRAALSSGATVCGVCGYHLVLKKVISLEDGDKTRREGEGLDRWVRSMMEDGESLDSVFMLMHALLAFVGILLAVIYHPTGWLVLGAATILYVTFFVLGRSAGIYNRLSIWGWEKLLGVYRRRRWRTLLPPFAARTTYERHDLEFGDDDLMAMEDIFDFQVLDLEGTSISDRGLLHLAGCDRLQFVVLRRTQVTRKGVVRLQSMLPQVLVWR